MEKRFNVAFMKDLKVETHRLVNLSEKMMRDLLSIFDKLETGVSRRNPALYITESNNFVTKFNAYHKEFTKYHNKIIVPLREYQATMAAEQKAQTEAQERSEIEQAKQSPFVTPYQEQIKPPSSQPPPIPKQTTITPEIKKQKSETLNKLEEEAQKSPPVIPYQEPTKKPLPPKYIEPTFKEWEENFDYLPDEEIPKAVREWQKKQTDHTNFIAKITKYANAGETSSLVEMLLDYSEQLENNDPEVSANLLTVANNIMNDKTAGIFDVFKKKPEQELQRQSPPTQKKEKPSELAEYEGSQFEKKRVDLPNGVVDQAYTDIPFLKNITPDKILISPAGAQHIITHFIKRLIDTGNIDDPKIYYNAISTKLIPLLQQAIYNGWVRSISGVMDNPNYSHDKYLDIYTRLNLSDIDPNLKGIAKLYCIFRVSGNGVLTFRSIKKQFDIENVREISSESDEDIDVDYEEPQDIDYPEDYTD